MNTIEKVCVCGAGTMGSQIAYHCALNGYQVTLYDIDQDQLNNAKQTLANLMNQKIQKNRISQDAVDAAFGRLSLETVLETACTSADLVIEAVVEDLDIKRELFAQISEKARADAILATNSSSIVSSKLSDVVSNPERLCNIHFFNPALVLPLVEVVKGEHTSESTIIKCIEFVERIKKTPVRLDKEIFGFVTNRILGAIFDEAISLYEQKVATFEQIDTAVKAGLNHPLGPFELLDLTGIDVNYGIKILEAQDAKDPSKGPSKTLTELYEDGHLGKKTGKGFYEYGKGI